MYLACLADFAFCHWEMANLKLLILDNGTSITEAQIMFVCIYLLEPITGIKILEFIIVLIIYIEKLSMDKLK